MIGLANDINEAGQVVGSASIPGGETHAFSWTQEGGLIDLGTLGGSVSEARAVNEAGLVVGSAWMPGTSTPHAFVWSVNEDIIDLGTLGGAMSEARAVNDYGQAVGSSTTATGEEHAFSWTRDGGMKDLGTLGGTFSTAVAVSDGGQVVGRSTTADGRVHAFRWTPVQGMVDLGTLGGVSSEALGINESGEIVGAATKADGAVDAFAWTQEGGMADLGTGTSTTRAKLVNERGDVAGYRFVTDDSGTLATRSWWWSVDSGLVDIPTFGGQYNWPYGLNSEGQVVGESYSPEGAPQAFSWTKASGIVNLGALDGTAFSGAYAVNDSGQIVGQSGGRAVMWIPVPPDTMPPALSVQDIAADATSPAGAVVSYEVSATDVVDPAPVVSCAPASGSTFPIGDTSVICTASDFSGNTASASFLIHVRGAAEQLSVLHDTVLVIDAKQGIITSLDAKLAALPPADATTAAVDIANRLDAFVNEVEAQSGKALTTSQAMDLIDSALRISAVLGF